MSQSNADLYTYNGDWPYDVGTTVVDKAGNFYIGGITKNSVSSDKFGYTMNSGFCIFNPQEENGGGIFTSDANKIMNRAKTITHEIGKSWVNYDRPTNIDRLDLYHYYPTAYK